MINLSKILKLKNNLIAYIKRVGVKNNIQETFLSPLGLFTNPKNKKAISIFGYTFAIHDFDKLPIILDVNDVILTDNKSYLHISYNNNTINIKTNHDININSKDNINIKTSDYNLNTSNSITNTTKAYSIISDNYSLNNSNTININTSAYNLNSSNKINISSNVEIVLSAPKITLNTDNLTFNLKTFEVNASDSIKFNSPTFTHNGVNVGSTHKHFVDEVIFGGTKSDVPQ